MCMETNCTQQYIADLLDRFMAGATSLDEEQVLHDYLLSADDLPKEWEAYRQMFEYFDAGMAGMEIPKPQSQSRPRRWWLAAASLLVLAGMAAMWSLGSGSDASPARSPGVGEGLVSQLQPADSADRSLTAATGSLVADVICPPAYSPVVVSLGKEQAGNKAKRNSARRQRTTVGQKPADRRQNASPAVNHQNVATTDQEAAETIRSFSEMREQQAMAIHNEVVEAIYEMLPDVHDQLHLATDESGAYAIVPTTLVREL